MKRTTGFSLIELMIAVSIIGILAAIAIPQFSEYVDRAKLTDGFSLLSDLRARMERYYQDNRQYTTTANGTDCGVAMPTSGSDGTKYFTYSCTGTSSTFTITATSNTNLGSSGAYVFTINEANSRATTKFKGATVTKACWVTSATANC